MSKLDEAKKVTIGSSRRRQNYGPEEFEVAVAWLKGEIHYQQIAKAYGFTGSNVYNFLAGALREMYRRDLLKVK